MPTQLATVHSSGLHFIRTGQLMWPSLAEVNTRARRLVSAWLKQLKKEEQKLAQLQKVSIDVLWRIT